MRAVLAPSDARFATFKSHVDRLVKGHPIVRKNPFTTEFAKGTANLEEVRRFTQQFSVFSHQFIVAQLHKVINSADVESYHLGKEILLNELGVVFRATGGRTAPEGVDPNIVGVEGTVDGSTYRHAAAHFEWLVNFAKPLGLTFQDLGKPTQALPSTKAFCDALISVYGSSDPSTSAGASFAIENWAAAGFWKELIQGFSTFKELSGLPLNLGFWVFHDKLEEQHASHTAAELSEDFQAPWFKEERYLEGAKETLDAVQAFWEGLAAAPRQTGRGQSPPSSARAIRP